MTLQVFLSIKGIYYQVDIQGQTVTWITPYQFSQEVSQSAMVYPSSVLVLRVVYVSTLPAAN